MNFVTRLFASKPRVSKADEKVTDWLNKNDTNLKLDLSHLQLTVLPALPTNVKKLDCSDNLLTELPDLPKSLIWLFCGNNKLAKLPHLPTELERLICRTNLLTHLPELPVSLSYLSCEENGMTVLPLLPNKLIVFDCGRNQCTELPKLPVTLQYLRCNNNHLTKLPKLPKSLKSLTCHNNNLIQLPDIPTSLESLICDDNKLTSLPNSLSHIEINTDDKHSFSADNNFFSFEDCQLYNTWPCFMFKPLRCKTAWTQKIIDSVCHNKEDVISFEDFSAKTNLVSILMNSSNSDSSIAHCYDLKTLLSWFDSPPMTVAYFNQIPFQFYKLPNPPILLDSASYQMLQNFNSLVVVKTRRSLIIANAEIQSVYTLVPISRQQLWSIKSNNSRGGFMPTSNDYVD